MQVFVRGDCTMIAAPVQCDVDGVAKWSHYITVSTIKVRLRSFLINGHGRLLAARHAIGSAHAPTDALVGQFWRLDGRLAVEHRPADVVTQLLVVEYELADRLRELSGCHRHSSRPALSPSPSGAAAR